MRKGEKLICNFNDRLFSPPLDEAKEDLMKRCYVRRRREGRQGPVMPLHVVAIVSVTTMLLHANLEFACLLKSSRDRGEIARFLPFRPLRIIF